VVSSLILQEEELTFISELQFLLQLDPSLSEREIIFLVDGDRGRINAIIRMLPKALFYLCLWHKQENIKTHFNPVLNSLNNKSKMKTAEIKDKLKELKINFKSGDKRGDLIQLLKNAKAAGLVEEVTSSGIEEPVSTAHNEVEHKLDLDGEEVDKSIEEAVDSDIFMLMAKLFKLLHEMKKGNPKRAQMPADHRERQRS